jgi:hypothetical protein
LGQPVILEVVGIEDSKRVKPQNLREEQWVIKVALVTAVRKCPPLIELGGKTL